MAFPDRLLADDESVVLHLHPHWKVLLFPVLVLVLVAGIAGFAIAFIDVGIIQLIIAGLALLVVCWVTVRRFVIWGTTHFVITTHRVLLREGLLSRSGRDVPLARINDVSFEHSLLERILRCGTLVVESAGERGQVVLRDIPRVESVQSTLYQLVESDHERRASFRPSPDDPGDGT